MTEHFRATRLGSIAFIVVVTLMACSVDDPTGKDAAVSSLDIPVVARVPNGHLKYVAIDGGIHVYDMEDGHRPIKTIALPGMSRPRGIAANAVTNRLYIPYLGDRQDPKYGGQSFGYLLCLDLKTDHVVWTRTYEPSTDSLSITPDGQMLYMPSGEEKDEGFWFVLDALSGEEMARIPFFKGAHNTITSLDGSRVYLTSLQSNFLAVADTRTKQVVRKIGPFGERIRPFAINGRATLAFVTVNFLSGFEVADLNRGRLLYRVQVEGFPWVDPPLPYTQSHGIALSPDEREVWVVDAHNRLVHVFDVTVLPSEKPRQIAHIDVSDPGNPGSLPKWINFSRDGRLAHVSTGAIIDARSRKIIAKVAPSRYFLQINTEDGEPVHAYSRYGVGYLGPAQQR